MRVGSNRGFGVSNTLVGNGQFLKRNCEVGLKGE